VAINNQCSDIELISPVYFTKDAMCHIQFPQQVNSESRMKANFINGIDQDTFGGALLYHLQRKDNNESDHQSGTDKNTSISIQLLVIWRHKLDDFYAFALPIEYDATLIWNEDKLKELYHVYDRQYDIKFTSDWKACSLSNNLILKTKCRLTHGGFKMNIIISEERKLIYPIKPLWIDPIR
jgi:hypothetical protein